MEKKLTIFYKDKECYSIKSDNIMTVNKKYDSINNYNVKKWEIWQKKA